MDLGQIVAIYGGIFSILGVMIGLFLYLAGKIDSLKKDINEEMRDFHGRLCSLEARYLDTNYIKKKE